MMKREQFSTVIHAPKEKVWRVLWGEDTYPVWTSYFGEGSRAETDWQEGSKVHFLNANNEGMVSRIVKSEENQYMGIEHLGTVDVNGKEDTESEIAKSWGGSQENYTLKDEDGKTKLIVDVDVEDSHSEEFRDLFPKALRRVKELAEEKSLP